MSLDVEGDALHLLRLSVNLVNVSMGFQTVDRQQTEAVAENVEVVLVVSLTLVQKPDLELLLPVLGGWHLLLLKNLLNLSIGVGVVLRVHDDLVVLDLLDEVTLHLFLGTSVLHSIQVVIVKFSNKLFELCGVLVQVDIGHLLLAQDRGNLPGLPLPGLGNLVLLLLELLLLSIALVLHEHLANLVLQGILLLDHLSLEGNVESPLVVLFVLVQLLKGPPGLVLQPELLLQHHVVLVLLLGDLSHGLLDLGGFLEALVKHVVLDGVDLAVAIANARHGPVSIPLEHDVVVSEVGPIGVNSKGHIETLVLFDVRVHVHYL